MRETRADVPYGSLDILVMKTLDSMGPTHGYGIARRIEQVSANVLTLNQGTLYPALVRLEQDGLIQGTWGTSENGRRARFYELTKRGQKGLREQIDEWVRMTSLIDGVLGVQR